VTGVAEPRAFPRAFADRWHSRDGRHLAELFAEDAEFVNVVGRWWRTRADIARAHDYALKSFFAGTRLSPGVTTVRQLGDGHAVVRCRFRLTGQRAPDGSVAGDRRTVFTFVLEARDAGWICVSAQNTDIVDGAETHLNTGTLTPADYRA